MEQDHIAASLGKIFSLKHVLFRTFDTSTLGLDITKTEERVLMMAWHHDGSQMQYLGRESGLEKGSLTAVVDSLEAKGLVSRVRDETDRRSFTVSPTTAGARQAEQIEDLFRAHFDSILGKLPPEERLEFEKAAKTFDRLIPFLSS